MFPTFEINVGLLVNGAPALTVKEVTQELSLAGFHVTAQRVVTAQHDKGVEPTVVARVIYPHDRLALGSFARFLDVAYKLRQDAIAVVPVQPETWGGENRMPSSRLIGPKADEWGPFNPEYFHPFSEDKVCPL